MFIFPYFREHVINIHGSHIRHRIIIIRTGAVVWDVITYHEVNLLAIIWNAVWNNVWNTVIVVCDGVPIHCIDIVNRKEGKLNKGVFLEGRFLRTLSVTAPVKRLLFGVRLNAGKNFCHSKSQKFDQWAKPITSVTYVHRYQYFKVPLSKNKSSRKSWFYKWK